MLPLSPAPNVRLAVMNLPENVSLVREVLAGLAGILPLEQGQLDDVKTVVSEACNNVVLHAYAGARGPLQVEIRVTAGGLEIAVRDAGGGLHPRARAEPDEIEGIGIPVIRALSDRVEFTGSVGHGTEVRMHFDVPGAPDLAGPAPSDPPTSDQLPTPLAADMPDAVGGVSESFTSTTATLVVEPLSIASRVLSRPLTALAARARFSIDRLSDVQLVTDAIAAHAGRSLSGNRLAVGVAFATRDLELRVGPLRRGMAEQLISDTAIGGLDPLIETLADEVTIESFADADVLTLRMRDTR